LVFAKRRIFADGIAMRAKKGGSMKDLIYAPTGHFLSQAKDRGIKIDLDFVKRRIKESLLSLPENIEDVQSEIEFFDGKATAIFHLTEMGDHFELRGITCWRGKRSGKSRKRSKRAASQQA
jgi:hypothetical protein